jgi:hypothetical protein
MVSVIQANQVSIEDLIDRFGLTQATQLDFFPEWSTDLVTLTKVEEQYLDRVKSNFTRLMRKPPVLENSVKLIVLAPLLDAAGFYEEPFRIESETSIELALEDEGVVIRGRIDILVLQDRLWLLILESKRSDFSVHVALGQALTYMMGNPNRELKIEQPTFGMISNGNEFLFLKLVMQPQLQYANSKLFSLLNPGNDLYEVLKILKQLGAVVTV